MSIFKTELKQRAKARVFSYNFGPTELLLENYIQTHYNIKLKQMCFLIIDGLKIDASTADEVIVYFTNEAQEKIARIITFGTGKLLGSRILTKAFATLS